MFLIKQVTQKDYFKAKLKKIGKHIYSYQMLGSKPALYFIPFMVKQISSYTKLKLQVQNYYFKLQEYNNFRSELHRQFVQNICILTLITVFQSTDTEYLHSTRGSTAEKGGPILEEIQRKHVLFH